MQILNNTRQLDIISIRRYACYRKLNSDKCCCRNSKRKVLGVAAKTYRLITKSFTNNDGLLPHFS